MLERNQSIYIFGAHSRAQTLAVYLRTLYPGMNVRGFLVDNDEANPSEVEGAPVVRLTDEVCPPQENGGDMRLDTSCPVYLGVQGRHHGAATAKLQAMGFADIRPVTPGLDMELRNRYLRQRFSSEGRSFEKIGDRKACIYVAKSIHDRPLKAPYEPMAWERDIQVGAALADGRLYRGAVTDDTGENISARNRQYCELTALYWIWRNAREEIAGLSHYRRHFLLPEDWVERMEERGIDVILPTPLYVAPTLAENFRRRHDPDIWDCMMETLERRDVRLFHEAERFFQGNLYSPCNMLVARRPALNELCGWMFPVLDAVVEIQGQKADMYQNRYPGFLSERLMTFFFERNRDRYKVVYADKNFLE